MKTNFRQEILIKDKNEQLSERHLENGKNGKRIQLFLPFRITVLNHERENWINCVEIELLVRLKVYTGKKMETLRIQETFLLSSYPIINVRKKSTVAINVLCEKEIEKYRKR